MADDIQAVMFITAKLGVGGTPADLPFYATKDTLGNYTLQSTPRVMGAQVDDTNRLPVDPGAPLASINSGAALVAFAILSTSPAAIHRLDVLNTAGAVWVMVFDSATRPADGSVAPKYCWYMPSNPGDRTIEFKSPVAFATGITVCISSSGPFELTSSATALISAQVE
jgi:hypothetical protein